MFGYRRLHSNLRVKYKLAITRYCTLWASLIIFYINCNNFWPSLLVPIVRAAIHVSGQSCYNWSLQDEEKNWVGHQAGLEFAECKLQGRLSSEQHILKETIVCCHWSFRIFIYDCTSVDTTQASMGNHLPNYYARMMVCIRCWLMSAAINIRKYCSILLLPFCRDRVSNLISAHDLPKGVDPKIGRGKLHQKQFVSKVCIIMWIMCCTLF